MRKLLGVLTLLVALVGCGEQAPVIVQCPPESRCDVNVQPPPMSPTEIAYHQQQNNLAQDVLAALILQDMMWRSCWDCYGPTWSSRYGYYSTYTPAQRTTVIQQNQTVITNNRTTINQASAKAPTTVKSQPVAAPPKTQPAPAAGATNPKTPSGGTGGGSSFKTTTSGKR